MYVSSGVTCRRMGDLATYLKVRKVKVDDFAARIRRSKASVSRIAHGKHNTDRDTMQAIIDATDGEVTPDSFFPLPPSKALLRLPLRRSSRRSAPAADRQGDAQP